MTCSEAKLKLEPCASGTLPAEEKIALEEHLATCEGCRLELELTRAVLGSPAFDGTDEPAPNNPEQAPISADTPVVPSTFEPPTAAEIDSEISFADLSLDESPKPADPVAPGPAPSAMEPATPAAAAGGKQGGGDDNLWDFEPVDAQRDVGPPEGSLSFANEALTRKREEEQKRKATMLRLALWGGGIFGGVLLLGISVWIALAFRQGNQNDDTPQPKGTNPPPAGVAPPSAPGTAPAPTSTPADSSAAAPTGAATSPATTPAPDATTPGAQVTPPAPAATPGPDHVVQVPSAPDAQVPVAKKPTPKPPKPVAKPAPKPAPRDTHADDGEDTGPSWSPSDLQPAPTASKPVPKSPDSSPTPSATAPPVGQVENPPSVAPQMNPGTPGGQTTPAPSTQPAPTAPTATVPQANPAPSNPPAPAGDATPAAPSGGVTKPIDRLHLATVTATENQDLVTLRKLKESWKAILKSVAGPDRSRTKREMADCLWAIQELSGRVNDRKEALAAYRDYVLTAPAGGVESRSLSRMRYLEESLGEDK